MIDMAIARILVIDDNPAVTTALRVLFALEDWDTVAAESAEAGLRRLAAGDIDLVIQDMNFSTDTTSGLEGIELFRRIRQHHADLPVILLTAWTHLDTAVELVKSGAADYLGKPWDDAKLRTTVRNLIELSQAQRALRGTRSAREGQQRKLEQRFDLCGMVFDDPGTERVVHLATQVARSTVPVLITGPNGAGKEKLAEIIQANSNVKSGPFVTLNCGAIPAELMEAELFGSEAGAYTGANKAREGKFEAADGGTLFLDEIGNLSLQGQMKLLRVIESGKFSRLGSNRETQVRVRLISATNADLPAMIKAGAFREDLFYRVNVIELNLPPLAERTRDVLPLARHFLRAGQSLTRDAERALLAHAWPGNVRELKNVMQRAGLLAAGDTIRATDLGLPTASNANRAQPDTEAESLTRESLLSALDRCAGNVSQAAAELGLSRQALYRRMERFGIDRAP